MQPDTVGNRLKEVQEGAKDLALFGKALIQHHLVSMLNVPRQDGEAGQFRAFPRSSASS